MKKIYFICLIQTALLTSCVVYYKTEDIRKTIYSNVTIADENQAKINVDYGDKLSTYNWLETYVINKNLEPFKSITSRKNEMTQICDELNYKTEEIMVLQISFEELSRGKKEIKSNEEAWKKFKVIKKNMKNIQSKIDLLNVKYLSASNALANTISNSHFKMLSKNELKTNIENNFSHLSDSLKNTSTKITHYRKELDNVKSKISDSLYNHRINTINQMNKLLSYTKDTQAEIEKTLDELLKKSQHVSPRDEIWTGKNTTTEIDVTKIQDGISQINETQALFNKLAASINQNTN
jgi:hypothetical protein